MGKSDPRNAMKHVICIMSMVIHEWLMLVLFINNDFEIYFFFSSHILIASSLEYDNSTTLVSIYSISNQFCRTTYNSIMKVLA